MKNECIIDIITAANAAIIYAHAVSSQAESVVRLNNTNPENISSALEAVIFSQLNLFHPHRVIVCKKTESLIPESATIFMNSTHVNLAVQDISSFSKRLMNDRICRHSPNLIVNFSVDRGAA